MTSRSYAVLVLTLLASLLAACATTANTPLSPSSNPEGLPTVKVYREPT